MSKTTVELIGDHIYQVGSNWECAECPDETCEGWTFVDVVDAGTPVCGECGDDMELVSVNIPLKTKTNEVRDEQINNLVRESGLSQKEIADKFGLTRQRVHQIISEEKNKQKKIV